MEYQDDAIILIWKEFKIRHTVEKERSNFCRNVKFFHKLDCECNSRYKKLEKMVDILTNQKLECIMMDKDSNKQNNLFSFTYVIEGQTQKFVSEINKGMLISSLNSMCCKPKDVLLYSDEPIEIMYRPRKEPIIIE